MAFRLPPSVTEFAQTVSHAVTGKGGDSRYFHCTRKGEIHELKEELHSANKEKKKDAIKKVIAAMTLGRDVSGLFPDVVNCMQTTNIELKKLVYLYVINYAKLQPELAILAINTFRKDTLDSNPLIRALAVRTMGCIKLEQVVEYLVEPLRKACKDTDPYVRKTAATCICKLHSTSSETVEDQGFIELLKDMATSDGNPTVVANAVASLAEISQASRKNYLDMNESLVSRLLAALNETSEWGQVFLIDAMAQYEPSSSAAAAAVIERITARLSHVNAAVVLSTARLIFRMFDYINDASLVAATQKKIVAPLITLLSAESEIQYVALRNISLIVQKFPQMFVNEMKMFICKYNDPHYVKMEKLEILVRLANEKNIDQLLIELREYATEVDVEFVRRTIRAIGRCAIRIEKAADKCVAALLSLIDTRVNYTVQEAIVVIRDVFRKYPNRYESVISKLCENMEVLDEPEAKASMVWIIGEYAERIENPDELLETFLDDFHDVSNNVKQQILTAAVKIFLKLPSRSQDLIARVLKLSTEESGDPDLRDRGFIYWRLLSTNPEATKKVVLGDRPPISDVSFNLDAELLDRLIENISTLSSVFHKVPEAFITRLRTTDESVAAAAAAAEGEYESESASSSESESEEEEGHANTKEIRDAMKNVLQFDGERAENESAEEVPPEAAAAASKDLLDLQSDEESDEETSSSSDGEQNDEFGDFLQSTEPSTTTTAAAEPEWIPLLSPETKGTNGQSGIGIAGFIQKRKDKIYFRMKISNSSTAVISGDSWKLQINKNSFGFAPSSTPKLKDLPIGSETEASIILSPNVNPSQTAPAFPLSLQVACKTSTDVFYLNPLVFDVSVVLSKRDAVSPEVFKTHWTRMGESKQQSFMGLFAVENSPEALKSNLKKSNVKFVLSRTLETFSTHYFSAVTVNNLLLLFEISLQTSGKGIKVTMRADAVQMFPILQDFLLRILKLQLR